MSYELWKNRTFLSFCKATRRMKKKGVKSSEGCETAKAKKVRLFFEESQDAAELPQELTQFRRYVPDVPD